jgi:hypothetical protein
MNKSGLWAAILILAVSTFSGQVSAANVPEAEPDKGLVLYYRN